MKMPTEEELIELLETCWDACKNARISNGPMMYDQKDQTGRPLVDTLRMNTFHLLVSKLIDSKQKESWEG